MLACWLGAAVWLLVGAAACFSLDDATGSDGGGASHDRSLELAAIGGSGVTGQVYLTRPAEGAWLIRAAVLGPPIANGASYPMHLHAGRECDRTGAGVAQDLGAPVARLVFEQPPPGAYLDDVEVPRARLTSGYYFDVHMSGDASGRPIGCAALPD